MAEITLKRGKFKTSIPRKAIRAAVANAYNVDTEKGQANKIIEITTAANEDRSTPHITSEF